MHPLDPNFKAALIALVFDGFIEAVRWLRRRVKSQIGLED